MRVGFDLGSLTARPPRVGRYIVAMSHALASATPGEPQTRERLVEQVPLSYLALVSTGEGRIESLESAAAESLLALLNDYVKGVGIERRNFGRMARRAGGSPSPV